MKFLFVFLLSFCLYAVNVKNEHKKEEPKRVAAEDPIIITVDKDHKCFNFLESKDEIYDHSIKNNNGKNQVCFSFYSLASRNKTSDLCVDSNSDKSKIDVDYSDNREWAVVTNDNSLSIINLKDKKVTTWPIKERGNLKVTNDGKYLAALNDKTYVYDLSNGNRIGNPLDLRNNNITFYNEGGPKFAIIRYKENSSSLLTLKQIAVSKNGHTAHEISLPPLSAPNHFEFNRLPYNYIPLTVRLNNFSYSYEESTYLLNWRSGSIQKISLDRARHLTVQGGGIYLDHSPGNFVISYRSFNKDDEPTILDGSKNKLLIDSVISEGTFDSPSYAPYYATHYTQLNDSCTQVSPKGKYFGIQGKDKVFIYPLPLIDIKKAPEKGDILEMWYKFPRYEGQIPLERLLGLPYVLDSLEETIKNETTHPKTSIETLIDNLGHQKFRTRETASQDLIKWGKLPPNEIYKKTLSNEQQRRLKIVVEKIQDYHKKLLIFERELKSLNNNQAQNLLKTVQEKIKELEAKDTVVKVE